MKLEVSFLRNKFNELFEQNLLEEMVKVGVMKELEEGQTMLNSGKFIRSVPIILEGSVKISRKDNDGKEALLYYLNDKDSCAISLTCCLNHKQSEVVAVADKKTLLLMIPTEKVEEWMSKYASWKQFVFMTYQKRFDDLLTAIDQIVFLKLDERLVALLKKKAKQYGNHTINITHEELGIELATSREVISRLLKQLERLGKVKLSRNKIELIGV